MKVSKHPVWHQLSIRTLFKTLATQRRGLSEAEASQRLQRDGPNCLPAVKKSPLWLRFARQFNNLLIYVLLFAGFMTLILGHWVDAGVIFAVVVINALIGVIQEGKAEQALDAIRHMLSPQAMVCRDGRYRAIDAAHLVVGDWLKLQRGDKIPADLRLVRASNLQTDEALLTGESLPVEKDPAPVEAHVGIGDRRCMLYSGTLITRGQAQGVVIATGEKTELGRISALLKDVELLTTPLLRQLEQFARWLTLGILTLAFTMYLFGFWVHDHTQLQLFLSAVGLAVAAIPEGLPAIMTITLAIGVQHMAKRNAIIRRLPAVETLGSVSVICSDKTGTLTRNEMTARAGFCCNTLFDVSGHGYDPHGILSSNEMQLEIEHHPWLEHLVRIALLCNDTSHLMTHPEHSVIGDPMEAALVIFAHKSGMDIGLELERWQRNDTIPFESEHRLMATLHHDHQGHGLLTVKGAPEKLLNLCNEQLSEHGIQPLQSEFWQEQLALLACQGMRVLALAYRPYSDQKQTLSFSDLESGLVLAGLVGFIDPPRPDAIKAIEQCQHAGIQVKMITGDHLETARAIGRMLGMADHEHALTGEQIEAMSNEALADCVRDVAIFARTSPEHKLRLVTALQTHSLVVAMTGDGVNDAPALKRADVGIAMGAKGTEVTKEAAEMVLTDDNFASIVQAIRQGRTVYDNLKKAILFILPTNGGEALCIMAAVLSGMQLPITAVQILWVNMITAVTLALALAFEPPEHHVMRKKPRQSAEPLLSGFLIWRIVLVSFILLAGTFGLFIYHRLNGMGLDLTRTIAVNTLVMFEIFYLFNARYFWRCSLTWRGITENPYILIACSLLVGFQMLFTYSQPMQQLFATQAMTLEHWLCVILIASSVLWLVELEKGWLRWRSNHHS